ncbi:MAG: tRNA (guanosine(46)-N7)-methyltransferase TrmB [Bacteroidales bacterium]|nr:tRNA (guanosine(46)-N7)-methyltransferase TrmB [Bacteroidales bacterium]
MGHGKLKKFAENETFHCLLQPAASEVLAKEPGSRELLLRDHPIKGGWAREMFGNSNPIVLELGCGGGEYTIALAQRHPEINYIGVDIKGARLWKGAKFATENALPNVAFLRTRIEFITAFFGPGEVSEIWLTFSDPQLSGSQNSRLSSPMFLARYRSFLHPGGIVHLKTDSRFLYEYTMSVVRANGLEVLVSGTDIYGDGIYICKPSLRDPSHLRWAPPSYVAEGGHRFPDIYTITDLESVFEVQTFYEKMFLDMGLPITYMAFVIDHAGDYAYPADFDADYWRGVEGPRRSFSHQPASKH